MSWGAAFSNAWSAASARGKAAAQEVAASARSAYDYGKAKAIQGYNYAKEAAAQGYRSAKGAAAQGYQSAKNAAVGAARGVMQGASRAAIEARYIQAAGPAAAAKRAYGKARSALGLNKAGSPVQPCPRVTAKCKKLKDALDKAMLAENTYKDDAGKPSDTIAGYKRLDPVRDAEEFRKLGITNPKEMLEPKKSDFRARIYKRVVEGGKTEYVIGFRGTQPTEKFLDNFKEGANWRDNIEQPLGGAADNPGSAYSRAMRLAIRVNRNARKLGASVSYTGHSLGGGLASAAAVVTGQPAVTHNAAGLLPATVGGRFPDPPAPVQAIFTPSDPLSFGQDNLPIPKAYGTRQVVPFPDGEKVRGILDTHGMRLVIAGIEQEQKDAGCVR